MIKGANLQTTFSKGEIIMTAFPEQDNAEECSMILKMNF